METIPLIFFLPISISLCTFENAASSAALPYFSIQVLK
jgi:hypothetical protein